MSQSAVLASIAAAMVLAYVVLAAIWWLMARIDREFDAELDILAQIGQSTKDLDTIRACWALPPVVPAHERETGHA